MSVPPSAGLRLMFALAVAAAGARADERTDAVGAARQGNFTSAVPVLERLAAAGDTSAGADLVAVLVWAGRPADALAAWSRLPPDARPAWVDADAARALALLGGGQGARGLVPADAPDLDEAQAAALVRLASQPWPDSARRHAAADRALGRLDALAAAERARPAPDAARLRRLAFDRWAALLARDRADVVAREFEAWPEPADALPAHARNSAAGALLRQRDPKRAGALYASVLRDDPVNADAALGRFYALVESEDFAAAYAHIDRLLAAEPAAVRYGDGAAGDNPAKVGYAVTAALARLYGGEQAVAWERISALAAAAPGNGYIRREAASVMAGRGWLRRAEAELRRVAALDPADAATRLAEADLALARREFARAGAEIADLRTRQPDNPAVRRLGRAWDLHRRRELYFRTEFEQGDSPDQRGTSWRSELELWSPPLADVWRVGFVGTAAAAEIPEGDVTVALPAVGALWTRPDTDLLLRVGGLASDTDRLHAGARVRHAFTDAWSAEAAAMRTAPETPLRGLHYGIHSDTVEAALAWTPHESRRLAAGAGGARFTSGNRRRTLRADWRERVLARPHLTVDLAADAARATNSRPAEPYYNPARATDWGLALEARHTLQRRYERSLEQRLSVRAGRRDERGSAAGGVWSLRYALHRDFSDAAAAALAFATGRSRYDGTAERFTAVEATLHARF